MSRDEKDRRDKRVEGTDHRAGLRQWSVLRSGAGPAARNMAVDHALLENAASLGPVLRFYSWSEPAASFGYFQRYADVERMTGLRPLVRRPTGGGLVPHDADWTYSITVPPGDPWYQLRAVESYQRVHEWIRAAFERLRVVTGLAPCCQRAGPGQCFEGYEKFDVLWNGRKIAGAAQRRTRQGLLIQGSVQPGPIDVARRDWEQAMCDTGRAEQNLRWHEFASEVKLRALVEELVASTYSQADYNRRR